MRDMKSAPEKGGGRGVGWQWASSRLLEAIPKPSDELREPFGCSIKRHDNPVLGVLLMCHVQK